MNHWIPYRDRLRVAAQSIRDDWRRLRGWRRPAVVAMDVVWTAMDIVSDLPLWLRKRRGDE